MDWQNIVGKLRIIKEDFDKSYKCLNTDRPSRPETIEKHIKILFASTESIRVILNVNYSRLTVAHKAAADNFFSDVCGKLENVLSRKNIDVKLPLTLREEIVYSPEISKLILVTDSQAEKETEESNQHCTNSRENQTKMPLSVIEFLGLATKLIPEFDGKPENMQSFVDSLNLLDTVKESHEAIAVQIIKTKLKNSSRNLISNESSIAEIVAKLKASVKGESTEVLTAKILNVKQNNKSANNFVQEIEDLTKSLTNAYITDGLPGSLAEKYSTQVAVKSMARNASSERVRLIMEAGTFSNMNEAVTKFVNSCTDNNSGSNVLFYKSRTGNRGARGGGNGRGRGNYNRGRGNTRGRGRHQRGGNNSSRQNRGNYRTLCVHDQGNQHSPEVTHLGDNDN